ncbi:hypothetical protein [Streptomyces carminius]|uniref:hypothetical protein n=1 Tax=Streptomyces carminius TaxID=2665496 RepID=UPI001E3334C6|nr:hypothetical protein [Streptomyces carminius]
MREFSAASYSSMRQDAPWSRQQEPERPALVVIRHIWECSIDGAKGNEFDIPA